MKYFSTHELVSPSIYAERGDKALRYLNKDALASLVALRERFGPLYVNTYGLDVPDVLGAIYSFSGYHLAGEYNRSNYSGHLRGYAFDCKFTGVSAEEVREDIFGVVPTSNGYHARSDKFPLITEIELGISWFHFAAGNNLDDLLVYFP